MFTGIIQEIGEITNIAKTDQAATFTIKTAAILEDKKIGESIAVNGVCITITGIKGKTFQFDAMEETLKRTNLKSLKSGSKVNLEASLRLNQGLDGHFVQGHVDCEGEISKISKQDHNFAITIKFPQEISQHLAFKGSITVNGVSLTISDLQNNNFTVHLIPHTLKNTNLKSLKKGDKVNLETDLISKHLKRLLDDKANEVNYEFLRERNLI